MGARCTLQAPNQSHCCANELSHSPHSHPRLAQQDQPLAVLRDLNVCTRNLMEEKGLAHPPSIHLRNSSGYCIPLRLQVSFILPHLFFLRFYSKAFNVQLVPFLSYSNLSLKSPKRASLGGFAFSPSLTVFVGRTFVNVSISVRLEGRNPEQWPSARVSFPAGPPCLSCVPQL